MKQKISEYLNLFIYKNNIKVIISLNIFFINLIIWNKFNIINITL